MSRETDETRAWALCSRTGAFLALALASDMAVAVAVAVVAFEVNFSFSSSSVISAHELFERWNAGNSAGVVAIACNDLHTQWMTDRQVKSKRAGSEQTIATHC